MKEYLRKNGIRVGIIIAAVCLIIGLSSAAKNGNIGFIQNATGVIKSPVQKALSSAVNWFDTIYGYIYEYDSLLAENESLRSQLADAQQSARDGIAASEENVRLRTLLGYLEKHTTFDTEAAQITAWDTSNWISGFTISKGTDQGIEKGDCVINESGLLVGQVYEIGDDWASVRTVIDVNMDVGVLVGDGEIAAMVVGDYALMQDGFAKLSYFTEDTTLFVGDDVVTSGAGGAFPAGIIIGTITELRSEAGGQSYYAVVDPRIDLSTLSQVFIIKDFEVIE